ncbi:MAG: SMP-30/gluconolactonase/LRE family protein [Chitinophagaceae bacterium]|nr:SMP-30/gluconolactonase/LRE family protein [Chitinophagaceae bacterium]
MNARLLHASQCFLGEGPCWHPRRNSIFWVDIENRRLYEYNWPHGAYMRHWTFPQRVTLVVIDKDDRLILGMEGGVMRFDPDTGDSHWLLDLEKEYEKHRCNDGGVDREGRLWVGTLHRDFTPGVASLYCIGKDLVPQQRIADVTISNGIAWSHDDTRLYYIDSPRRCIESYLYDTTTGQIEFEKVAVQVPDGIGDPDGMTIDEEGMLWVAHWGSFSVHRWDPRNGQLLDTINVPAPNVSSCIFAGESLDHLVITTARQDLTPQQLKKYPHSGDVFVTELPVKGTPARQCSL